MKIGIIRERKSPPDFRVPLIPWQCAQIVEKYRKVDVVIEEYPERCYKSEEYTSKGLSIVSSLDDCDIICGVKEIPVEDLIPNKTYLFFSHTIKKQAHNRKLLQAILEKNIRMIDYECLRYPEGDRVLGFGKYAGIVGAYNGFRAWGKRYQTYSIKPANQCFDKKELDYELTKVHTGPIKILLTGFGRVGQGALEVLKLLNIREVTKEEFLTKSFKEAVYTHVDFHDYNKRKDNSAFVVADFFSNPELFESDFYKFLPKTDLLLAGHFWNSNSPRFFTREDMLKDDFNIKIIADISCDIDGPIPSTIRSSKIAEPFYGYDAANNGEVRPFEIDAVTVMAVDNLPCELPRDASEDFGNSLLNDIIPLLVEGDKNNIIANATIAEKGKLTEKYKYLQDYVDEK